MSEPGRKVSRNLLDPGAEEGDRDLAEVRPARWWRVDAMVPEVGLSRSRLHAIFQAIPPEHVEGRSRYWRMATVIRVLMDAELRRQGAVASGDALDPHQARARKDQALAEETELRVAEKRGTVVPVGYVAEVGGAALAALRRELETLGPTHAAELAETDDAAECSAIVRRAVESLLRRVADDLHQLGEHPPAA